VVGVGFSTGFFIIEADVGESTPASSSNCRCLMLHSFGREAVGYLPFFSSP